MCGGSILSCSPHNPPGHERALKEEEEVSLKNVLATCKEKATSQKTEIYGTVICNLHAVDCLK